MTEWDVSMIEEEIKRTKRPDPDDLLDKIEALGVSIMWHDEERVDKNMYIMKIVIAVKEDV